MHDLDPALSPKDVYDGLDPDVRQLVQAVATLYRGSWDDCAEDIRRRQAGRPYLFRLAFDIDDPLGWIRNLKQYESARGEGFAAILPREEG